MRVMMNADIGLLSGAGPLDDEVASRRCSRGDIRSMLFGGRPFF
jgi:hypothetical protein